MVLTMQGVKTFPPAVCAPSVPSRTALAASTATPPYSSQL